MTPSLVFSRVTVFCRLLAGQRGSRAPFAVSTTAQQTHTYKLASPPVGIWLPTESRHRRGLLTPKERSSHNGLHPKAHNWTARQVRQSPSVVSGCVARACARRIRSSYQQVQADVGDLPDRAQSQGT